MKQAKGLKAATVPKAGSKRATVLAAIIVLQMVCAAFFIGDVVEDLQNDWAQNMGHLVPELLAALALVVGVAFLMFELRRLLARMSDMQVGLDVARGQLADVIDAFFDEWQLTEAERDIALMILKGLDNDTIAQVRNRAPGTIRAQATSVYAKAGVKGRAQLVSHFMEELLSGEVYPAETP